MPGRGAGPCRRPCRRPKLVFVGDMRKTNRGPVLRTLLCIVFAASSLLWIPTVPSLAAQSSQSSADIAQKFHFLLPNGFRGWVCVDFGVVGAPPLPREGDALVIRPFQGKVLATSDKTDTLFLYGDATYEFNGQRRPLPDEVTVQGGPSRTGSAEPTERRCAFVGTIDEKDAAGEAPGFEHHSGNGVAIPSEERQALEALYKASGGDHWDHRVGWLGPPGTECSWHGVSCGLSDNEALRIVYLDLAENNLHGAIPKEIGQLRNLQSLNLHGNQLTGGIPSTLGQLADLEWLTLFGNHLSGLVPDPLIQRWLAGTLDISAESYLLTDISEIDFESSAPAVLCARQRIVLRADGSVVTYTERCRSAAPDDRTTFCEVKKGRIGNGEFGKIGWLIERSAFFELRSDYQRSLTHATFENTRVTRRGTVHEVSNYAGAGPFVLWTIQRAIEGVAAIVEWEKPSTQQECPRW